MMASVNSPLPMETAREIETRLSAIEQQEGVRLLLAVEFGSRAWGFPSPDSDYDVRFLYVSPRDRYLRLNPERDVIERPIVDEIDLNGWDVRKALGLLLKSNAVVSEWLGSPLRYRPDDPVVAELSSLADRLFDPRAMAWHYASLGRNAMERWPSGGEVPVKRYFYALRPALAVRALRLAPDRRPPMNLQALVGCCDIEQALARQIDELVVAKARSRELANTIRLPALDQLIGSELAAADEVGARPLTARDVAEADRLFLDLVNR